MKRIFLSLFAALLASSCAVYAPKTADIPRFEQRGDMQVAAAFDAATGVAISAAVAASDHIGIMVSGDAGFPDENQRLHSVRPAAGYYYAFPSRLTLGCYAGVEWGSCLYHNTVDHPYSEAEPTLRTRDFKTTTLFAQMDVVWAPATWVDLCARLAVGNFHYNNSITDSDGAGDDHTVGNSLLVEPTLQLRLGGKSLKALLSASMAYMPQFDKEAKYYYRPFTFGLGLSYHFNPFK